MSAVAQAAGVARDTFYRHASSPVELLQSVLKEELDEVPVPEAGGIQAFEAAESSLLAHIAKHETIYRNALVHGSEGPVRNLLTDRLVQSLGTYVDDHPEILPDGIRKSRLPHARAMAVAYAAAGTVGAIETWLRSVEPGENLPATTEAAQAILDASPAWWLQPLG